MRVLRVFAEELLAMQLVQPLWVEAQWVQLLQLVVLAGRGAGAKVEPVHHVGHVHPAAQQRQQGR